MSRLLSGFLTFVVFVRTAFNGVHNSGIQRSGREIRRSCCGRAAGTTEIGEHRCKHDNNLAAAWQEAGRVALLVRVNGVKRSESGIVRILWSSSYLQPWGSRPLATTTTAADGLAAARQEASRAM